LDFWVDGDIRQDVNICVSEIVAHALDHLAYAHILYYTACILKTLILTLHSHRAFLASPAPFAFVHLYNLSYRTVAFVFISVSAASAVSFAQTVPKGRLLCGLYFAVGRNYSLSLKSWLACACNIGFLWVSFG